MFYLLHCGGIPFDGNTIKTKSLGGSESAAYYVARNLAEQGHRVTLFTNCTEGMTEDGVRYEPAGQISEEMPLGRNYHFYATHNPHDVNITQRHPAAYAYRWASKINIWWLHDLALYRSKGQISAHLWNIDYILTVSEYHKQQIAKVWGINPEIIMPITNGVDFKLFEKDPEFAIPAELEGKKILTYSSRPERGLEHLVGDGGIMQKLGDAYHLFVCGYDNTTPETAPYYQHLWGRCDALPNVTNLGSLSKAELAQLMMAADAHIYPSTFEEVSCITAMECMAAGLPFIASAHAALPETCQDNIDSGSILIPVISGEPDLTGFVNTTIALLGNPKRIKAYKKRQLASAPFYSWNRASLAIEDMVAKQFSNVRADSKRVHYLEKSDIVALRDLGFKGYGATGIPGQVATEMETCYDFSDMEAHYNGKNEELSRDDITQSPRYSHVAGVVGDLDSGSVVIDYGCNSGHYVIHLAKLRPDCDFIGVDISRPCVEFAKRWAEDESLTNVTFFTDGEAIFPEEIELLLCGEVLEHVPELSEFYESLPHAKRCLFTTPYGPWEALSYEEKWPHREHLHHFEREDLHDMFAHFPGFKVLNIAKPVESLDLLLGFYATEFEPDGSALGKINYRRKHRQQMPCQTVSACLLVGNSENTILACLKSLWGYVDELVLRLDENITDNTKEIVRDYIASKLPNTAVTIFSGTSPTEIGFDTARNETLERATGDWILWLDTDETIQFSDGWRGLMRFNQFNGYSIEQHHFSADPPSVIKVDFPCRLFRNHIGGKFFGLVHEHPEITLNDGMGHVQLVSQIRICHYGYTDETVRRGRFERNYELLQKDRIAFPDRKLGRMLWLRDCAQINQWEAELNGGQISQAMRDRAADGVAQWDWLMDNADMRIVCDSMDFYSSCVGVLGNGVESLLKLSVSPIPNYVNHDTAPVHTALFKDNDHLKKFMNRLVDEGTKDIDMRYA